MKLHHTSSPYEDQTNSKLKDWVSYRLSFFPCGKAGGPQIRRCQGLAVDDYGCALGALTLEPSSFCNIEVNLVDS